MRAPKSGSRVPAAIAAGLALFAAAIAVDAARRMSPTGDEPKHVATAVYRLRAGRCCLGVDNGPTLVSNALLLGARRDPAAAAIDTAGNPWTEGIDYLLADGDLERRIWRARIPSGALLAALVAAVLLWSRRLYGDLGAILSAGLAATCPNLIAAGSLVTPDIHAACFVTIACWRFHAWSERPSVVRLLLAGVALGLALSAKHTAVALVAVFGALALFGVGDGVARSARARRIGGWAGVVAVAFGIVWLLYGTGGSTVSLNGTVKGVPFFADWLEGLARVRRLTSQGWHAYFLGEYGTRGWWTYFPVALAVKLSFVGLVAVAGAIALAPWTRGPGWRREIHVWLPAATLFAGAVVSKMNIGVRHVLPVIPLLFVMTGRLVLTRLPRGGMLAPRTALAAVAVLVATNAVEVVRFHPHELAYFNPLAGGPAAGYRIVADSNVDWGQDLPTLRDYLARNGIPAVRLAYGGPIPPGRYGIRYQPLPSTTPHAEEPDFIGPFGPRELVVVSVHNLLGIYPTVRNSYAWLRSREPVARLGYSLYVYDVTGDAEAYRNLVMAYRDAGMTRLAAIEAARAAAVR